MLAALALLGLMVSHRAHGSNPPQPAPNDIVCPNHYTPTFVHNSFTYLAPLHKFTNLTKSFFDISWYVFDFATVTDYACVTVPAQ
ncbi:hypothetical protein B0H14DRAFT_3437032 [Mycena olivaceomarginata]|nr:hypothetical protein B0H14DRAFT_3437032 [Mycena olivaceomarginata]